MFSGDAYYAQGGAEVFRGSYATVAECMHSNAVFDQWWNVLDTRTGRVFTSYDVNFDRNLLEDRLKWAAGIDSEA